MLLVALVALGSATYAWYITNATVTAEKTQFSAASADGLVIRKTDSSVDADKDWTNKITGLKHKSSLMPASYDYAALGNNIGATGIGTNFTDGALSGNLIPQDVVNGDYFLVDTFDVASSTETAKTATFTIKSGTKAGTYLNIAVYAGSTLLGVYTSDANAALAEGTEGRRVETNKVAGTKAAPVTATGTGSTQTLAPLTTNTVVTTSFSAATRASGGTTVTIVAFADGYNPLCKNSTADISTIDVEYSFTAA